MRKNAYLRTKHNIVIWNLPLPVGESYFWTTCEWRPASIFVHSIEPFYLDADGTYIASAGDALWVTLLDSAARSAVPLFVLTSSYLLFPVAGGTERFFRRRFTKVVVPFLFWAILYAVVPMWGSGGEGLET